MADGPIVLQVQELYLVPSRDPSQPTLARVILNPKRQVDPNAGVQHGAGVTLIVPLEEARTLYPLGSDHELALIPTDQEVADAT